MAFGNPCQASRGHSTILTLSMAITKSKSRPATLQQHLGNEHTRGCFVASTLLRCSSELTPQLCGAAKPSQSALRAGGRPSNDTLPAPTCDSAARLEDR